MSERDDSHDLAAMRDRLAASRERLALLPVSTDRHAGPTDPSTGESWHRGNVLGHTAEMLPFWTEQFQRAAAGSGKVGRDQAGTAKRRQGVDHGEAATEAELKLSVDKGIAGALKLLGTLTPADLERIVVYTRRDEVRDVRLGELVQTLIVVHVEEHLEQLAGLA